MLHTFAYKKFKKIKSPSLFYFVDDTKRSRPQLQVDLLNDFGNIIRLPHIEPCFVINHPDYIKHIFLSNHANYIKSDKSYQAMTDVMGQGVITNNGPAWKAQRLNLANLFQPHTLANYIPTMEKLTEETRQRWEQYAQQAKPFNLTEEIMSLTLRISARNFLHEELDEQFIQLVIGLSKSMNRYVGRALYFLKYLPLPSIIKLNKEKKAVKTYLLQMIKRRRQLNSPPNDLLTKLLNMRDENNQALNQEQLLGELKNFLVASYETVSHTLTWTWYNLTKHPKTQAKMRDEMACAVKENGMTALPYTKTVIEESMRLFPPAWVITRRAVNSDAIDDYFIPAGSHLLICPYAIHRHPDFWPEPEKFIPERFAEQNRQAINRYSYLPFGAGPRTCIASHLAITEAQTILAGLLPYFNLRLASKKKIKTQAFVFLSIKNGLQVIAEKCV